MKVLLEGGADVNAHGPEGRTPLFFAIYARSNDAVKLLVERGADLTVTDTVGYSPYTYAKSRSQTSVLTILQIPSDLPEASVDMQIEHEAAD